MRVSQGAPFVTLSSCRHLFERKVKLQTISYVKKPHTQMGFFFLLVLELDLRASAQNQMGFLMQEKTLLISTKLENRGHVHRAPLPHDPCSSLSTGQHGLGPAAGSGAWLLEVPHHGRH